MINRVFIREHISNDADAYIEWQTDTGIARYLSWLPRSRIEAEASLRKAIEQQNQTDRTRFYFAVVLHETQEVIGEVGFTLSEPLQASCGWFMRTDFQGQGYATEAVKQMIRYAFNSISLEVLMASCRRENAGSVRVMGKCGFILEKESERRSWYTQSRECCRTAL